MVFALTCGVVTGMLSAVPVGAVELGETVDIPVVERELTMIKSDDRGGAAVQAVTKTVIQLIDAIEKNDVETMGKLYHEDEHAVFYGAALAHKARGTRDFVVAQNQCRETLTDVLIRPGDMQVQYLGDVAVATLTGVNQTVSIAGEKSGSNWRWSLVLRNTDDGVWQISHEHYSFEEIR